VVVAVLTTSLGATSRARAAPAGGGDPPAPASAAAAASLRSFPEILVAEPVATIDPSGWGTAYRGGLLQRIVSDRRGRIYIATTEPCQLLRFDPAKGTIRELGVSGSADEECQGPWLALAVTGQGVVLGDGGLGRVRHLSDKGSPLAGAYVPRVFDVSPLPGGGIAVYPGSAGRLLDLFDAGLHYTRSIATLPAGEDAVGPSACHLLPDRESGLFALWNPTRTVYRLNAGGEILSRFTLDPPDLVANLGARLARAEAQARELGLQASINPFLDLLGDREGNLAALYPFEEAAGESPGRPASPGATRAALYRFTPDGGPIDVIHGIDECLDVAFLSREEILGIHADHRRLVRFRLRPPADAGDRAALRTN
jgi:hypothetical protein